MDYRKKKHAEDIRTRNSRPSRSIGGRSVSFFLLGLLSLFLLFIAGRYLWREKRWRFIVIHHSASDVGNLQYIRKLHMKERNWSDIAYHFVVNNGSMNTTIGQIEISRLWRDRAPNHSTRNPYINTFGIAIVVVGNFEKRPISRLQKEALIGLIGNLSENYNIPPERIVGHRDLQNTACPGKYLNIGEIREMVKKTRGKDIHGLNPP